MPSRKAQSRKAGDVTGARDATKLEIVAATLYLLGADTRHVPLDELAAACHRLAPALFSWPEYVWLANLDSVRVTLVDVKRAGLAMQTGERRGATLGGWRLTDEGRMWADRNRPFLDELRRRLPERAHYQNVPAEQLAALAVFHAGNEEERKPVLRERVVAEAFRLFPESFSLSHFPGWPDSAAVDSALAASGWIERNSDGFRVRADAKRSIDQLRGALFVSGPRGFGAAARKQTAGAVLRAVQIVERSALYRAFCAGATANAPSARSL